MGNPSYVKGWKVGLRIGIIVGLLIGAVNFIITTELTYRMIIGIGVCFALIILVYILLTHIHISPSITRIIIGISVFLALILVYIVLKYFNIIPDILKFDI